MRCCSFPFEYWAEQVEKIAKEHGYTDAEAAEYRRIIDCMIANGVPAK